MSSHDFTHLSNKIKDNMSKKGKKERKEVIKGMKIHPTFSIKFSRDRQEVGESPVLCE